MEIKTLSFVPAVPFNDTLETFFDSYKVDKDIECYQLFFSPYGDATNFDDLDQIKFNSEIVILNIIDSLIDLDDQLRIDKLKQFCENNPEQKFIIFNFHFNLKRNLSIPNLYLDTIWSIDFEQKLIPCEKENLSNNWICLNSGTKLHRVMITSYLLSKDYCNNGSFTFQVGAPTLTRYDKYRNLTKMKDDFRKDLSKGFAKFKSKDFNQLEVVAYDNDVYTFASNYNNNLLPVYKNFALEIVTGTMFFESTPLLSEKEIQSVYAKNFPIYMNGVGMAKEMKKFFDIDIFEDIIDHSYDDVEDHFDRIFTAINKNQHLLDGSTNIREMWYDNEKRFEENCNKMDSLFYDKKYKIEINHNKIKKALSHFNVTVK